MSDDRLFLEYIEQKPKTVIKSPSWRVSVPINDAQKEMIDLLITMIENGTPIPNGYYRPSMGTQIDYLLEQEGYMHLHIGSRGRSLLYLIQYPDYVVLVEISDHRHFKDNPAGQTLKALHDKAIKKLYKETVDAQKEALEKKKASIAGSLRRPSKWRKNIPDPEEVLPSEDEDVDENE